MTKFEEYLTASGVILESITKGNFKSEQEFNEFEAAKTATNFDELTIKQLELSVEVINDGKTHLFQKNLIRVFEELKSVYDESKITLNQLKVAITNHIDEMPGLEIKTSNDSSFEIYYAVGVSGYKRSVDIKFRIEDGLPVINGHKFYLTKHAIGNEINDIVARHYASRK